MSAWKSSTSSLGNVYYQAVDAQRNCGCLISGFYFQTSSSHGSHSNCGSHSTQRVSFHAGSIHMLHFCSSLDPAETFQ
ncbi:uncharacterized protein YALI1_C30052g [Yarrowia lipolytica]|uniref:Uncharacterized protein n=1 Tax=Yarrowia lipolytica TaxID=4952 RepID=A0A1D8NC61_YARLL|nr:hypothetical protein YALI1_C30052g [Yarrowia lipolytica]